MWALVCLLAMLADPPSSIAADEQIVFYPVYAYRTEGDSAWSVPLHGSVFEPERNSAQRFVVLELLRSTIGLSRQDSASEIFKSRASPFLVDNQRGKSVAVRLGGKVFSAGASGANGHFSSTIRIEAREVDRLRQTEADKAGWLGFQTVARPGDARTFTGRLQLVDARGRSVISDIDDTIKITQVRDRQAMLANTFLRRFEPVPGMAILYRRWADQGVAFHYVSASPWQLYQPLAEFCAVEGFPAGSFHLKLFRLKDSSAWAFLGPQDRYKSGVIQRILADFPGRRFILVGDSGEQDPEIYGAIARKHPDQIERILIRNVGGPNAEPARFQKAFGGVPPDRWQVFERPDQCRDGLLGRDTCGD